MWYLHHPFPYVWENFLFWWIMFDVAFVVWWAWIGKEMILGPRPPNDEWPL